MKMTTREAWMLSMCRGFATSWLDSMRRVTVQDMRLPGFKLHPLTADRKGEWAVTVRANWRVTFRIQAGEARDVNYEDYHGKKR